MSGRRETSDPTGVTYRVGEREGLPHPMCGVSSREPLYPPYVRVEGRKAQEPECT